jgi:hypothetical protein
MNFDSYRTIAEVSIALTGFLGIIVVLQHKDKSSSMILKGGTMMDSKYGGLSFESSRMLTCS